MQTVRLRRLREKSNVRDWISETQLHSKNIISPNFVVEGKGIRSPISSMPGIYHLSIDELLRDIAEAQKAGIASILLFGIPEAKDEMGSQGYKKDGILQKAVNSIKNEFEDLIVITDVCLCGYTSHGHCGIIEQGRINNDESLKALSKIALSHAEAGADFVAPSAMMDGQVKAIRGSLDNNGFEDVGILAYSAKYASNFYGPFREALDSTPQFGDRKSYQMDFRNSNEALRKIKQDIDEGADIVMIKPALAYLDVIYRAKQKFNIPVAAYNVSGEYAMVKGYCKSTENRVQRTEKDLVLEILTSIKRAGADLIITYWAKDVAIWLKQ